MSLFFDAKVASAKHSPQSSSPDSPSSSTYAFYSLSRTPPYSIGPAPAAADAAIEGCFQMGVVNGTLAAVAAPVIAGVATTVVMAAPLIAVAGVLYLFGVFDDKPTTST